MRATSIIPCVNAFIKTIRATPLRFKVENLPVAAKSFVTIPVGLGAVKLEVLKSTDLCIHVYNRLEIVQRGSKVEFQLKDRVYTSPLLTKSDDIQELLTTLAIFLPEAANCGQNTEYIVKEIECIILPLLKKNAKVF